MHHISLSYIAAIIDSVLGTAGFIMGLMNLLRDRRFLVRHQSLLMLLILALLWSLPVNLTFAQSTSGPAPSGSKYDGGFNATLVGHGKTPDGFGFSQTIYQRSTGEKVVLRMIHCDSSDGVSKKFSTEVERATKVIDRQPIQEKGVHEQRAVIDFVARDKNQAFMILITAGSVLREIQSYSLQSALQLEKQLAD